VTCWLGWTGGHLTSRVARLSDCCRANVDLWIFSVGLDIIRSLSIAGASVTGLFATVQTGRCLGVGLLWRLVVVAGDLFTGGCGFSGGVGYCEGGTMFLAVICLSSAPVFLES